MLNAAILLPDLSPRDLCPAGPRGYTSSCLGCIGGTSQPLSRAVLVMDGYGPGCSAKALCKALVAIVLQNLSVIDSPCPEGFLTPSLPQRLRQAW